MKRLAKEEFNFTFGNESVSTFVTAFYDAVVLYALALNETLEEGGSQRDGIAITRRMWNRTFEGTWQHLHYTFTVHYGAHICHVVFQITVSAILAVPKSF